MSKADASELHRDMMERAEDAHTFDFDNRTDALDDLQFAVGGQYQWPDWTNYQERMDDGRPCETLNQLGPFIHQIENDARENRPSIKVRGVDDDSDPETAEVFEGIVRHIEDQSEAVTTAYIPGVKNAATCGIGHWRVKTEYCDDDTFGQDIFIESIPNALGVLWDPKAKKATREDARFCFVIDDIPEDEFEERWPDAVANDFSPGLDGSFWSDAMAKTIRIAEYWVKEPYQKTIGRTRDGKVIDLTGIPAPSVKFIGVTDTRKVQSHRVVQYIISGKGLLEGPNKWAGKHIPIVALIAEEIWMGEKRVRKSLIRDAKAAQRLYNVWRNTQTEQVALQPKAPFMVEIGQLNHPEVKALFKVANRRNLPFLAYKHVGDVPPPQRTQPPQASSAMSEAVALAMNELRSTTGIYDAALGKKSNETSGIAIQNRQRESDVSNAHFSDNLALSIRHTGRILIDLIPSYYDTERVVRLLNEDGSERWETINTQVMSEKGLTNLHDLSVGKYDVTVKTGPSYQTRRQEAADFLLQFMQSAPDSAPFIMDILAKNLDAPGADELAKRFKMLLMKQHPEFFDQKDQEPAPPPTQADQQNALMGHLQVQEQQAKTQLTQAQAEDAEMDAALKGMQVAQLAAQGPIAAAVNQAVMEVLSKFGIASEPGQGAGIPPAQQPQQIAA